MVSSSPIPRIIFENKNKMQSIMYNYHDEHWFYVSPELTDLHQWIPSSLAYFIGLLHEEACEK